jgi:hypothetical protein
MTLLYAVRGPLTAEVVTLHNTRKSTTLTDTNDVYSSNFPKHTNANVLADFNTPSLTTQFADELLWLAVSFCRRLNTLRS